MGTSERSQLHRQALVEVKRTPLMHLQIATRHLLRPWCYRSINAGQDHAEKFPSFRRSSIIGKTLKTHLTLDHPCTNAALTWMLQEIYPLLGGGRGQRPGLRGHRRCQKRCSSDNW